MSKIQIGDQPRFITDEEVFVGRLVRSGTWRDVAEMINYLNRHACKVLPYTRWGSTVVTDFDFVYPVDRPVYSTRYLTCLFGMRPPTAAIAADVQVDSDSGGSDTFQSAGSGGGAASWAVASEGGVTYHIAQVAIEGSTRELIEITAEDGHIFNGFGAWELPPIEGGAIAMVGPGYSPGLASIADTVAEVVDPQDLMADKMVDATVLSDIMDAELAAFERNRRIIFQTAPGHVINWNVATTPIGTWVSLPQGGIYIPAYAISQDQQDAGYRHIRVACKVSCAAGTGTSQWRVETSRGNFNGTSWGGTPLTDFWTPMDPGTGVYDRTIDGIQVEVGLTGEWIQVGLVDNNDGAASHPSISQVLIWEE